MLSSARELPTPHPILTIIGMLTAAYVLSLKPSRRKVFLHALDVVIIQHERDPTPTPMGRSADEEVKVEAGRGPAVEWVKRLKLRLDRLAWPD